MTRLINLNADLGESYGNYRLGCDEALMEIIASANIACGYHAGDPLVLKAAVHTAKANKVSIGAHPSYPDLQGFGRRPMQMNANEIEAMVSYQIGALMGMAASEGASVTHVKAHGALSNVAAANDDVAKAIARGARAVDPSLILLAPVASCLITAGEQNDIPVAGEIFADRAYNEDATLMSRKLKGSMIHEAEESIAQIIRFLDAGGVVTASGKVIKARIDSICVHGDNPDAISIASKVRAGLEKSGVKIVTLPEVLAGG